MINNIFTDFISSLEIPAAATVMVHSAFSKIRKAFPDLTIETMIAAIQQKLTPAGSLIMPTFTYCFKRRDGGHEKFDRDRTPSKVGVVSEVFRKSPDVIRTSSPTHSFALWGRVTETIAADNAPSSPLGTGSVLEWMTNQKLSYILLLGVDFSSLSFGHYLEILAPVPWADYSPWDYLGVLPVGLSIHGEQPLKEVPGCAKSFIHFEQYLLRKKAIRHYRWGQLWYYQLRVDLLLAEGLAYFRKYPFRLLCSAGHCPACNARRQQFGHRLHT